MTETIPSPLSNVITIDDDRIKNHSTGWCGQRGGDVERASRRGGRSAVQRPALRAQRRPTPIPAPATTNATCRPRPVKYG